MLGTFATGHVPEGAPPGHAPPAGGFGEASARRARTEDEGPPSRRHPSSSVCPSRGRSVYARYTAFALIPVSCATTAAAGRGRAPASSRRARASAAPAAASSSPPPELSEGATTSTTSPRGGSPAYRSA